MAVYPSNQMPRFDPAVSLSYGNAPMYGSEELPKRHTACDECRHRKLKCSGESTGCSRCVKQSLLCHYSIQKQMGRPPKTKWSPNGRDDAVDHRAARDSKDLSMDQMAAYAAPDPVGTYESTLMCPSIYKSFMINSYDTRPGPFVTDGPIFENKDTNAQDIAALPQWRPKSPDYSQINAPLCSRAPPDPVAGSNFSPTPTFGSQELTTCSCLSHLYLCLSSLSTLSSFPPSSNILSTLYNAARVARSVIYCLACPQAFNTGVQNLMMLGTLLTVAGDAWFRLSNMDAETLGKETVCASYLATFPTDPELRQEHWKQWLRKVVKHGVIGSSVAPAVHAVQSQCLESPDLLTLIEELENRQRVRHSSQPCSSNKVDSQMKNGLDHSNSEDSGLREEQDYLCVRIAGNARSVLDRFEFEPEELRERESQTKSRPDEAAFAAWKD